MYVSASGCEHVCVHVFCMCVHAFVYVCIFQCVCVCVRACLWFCSALPYPLPKAAASPVENPVCGVSQWGRCESACQSQQRLASVTKTLSPKLWSMSTAQSDHTLSIPQLPDQSPSLNASSNTRKLNMTDKRTGCRADE